MLASVHDQLPWAGEADHRPADRAGSGCGVHVHDVRQPKRPQDEG